MNSLTYASENKDHTIRLREYFHQHPELSFQEFQTSAKICSILTELGIPYVKVATTGIIATIEGKNHDPVIGLRADMDALPVTEKNQTDYVSCHPGIMHACGHDAHIAILLTVAKFLSENKDHLNTTVKLIFQPAEETVQGAQKIINEHWAALEDIKSMIGLHVWNDLEAGKISVEAGPRMAATDYFAIKINGKMGHGSMPHQGIDSVYIASNIVVSLQALVSRMINPLEPAVISIGSFQSGTAPNIIANDAVLEGTVRCFSAELQKALRHKMELIIKNIAEAYGATYEFSYREGTPPVINDKNISQIACQCVTNILGADALVTMEKVMGGEDFAMFLEKIPGCFAFIGSGTADSYPQHHEKFDIENICLVNGVAFLIEYLLQCHAVD